MMDDELRIRSGGNGIVINSSIRITGVLLIGLEIKSLHALNSIEAIMAHYARFLYKFSKISKILINNIAYFSKK